MYEQDYIMRQIDDLARAIAKMFFNVNVESPATEIIKDMQAMEKAQELLQKSDEGKICYAEADLFDLIKDNSLDNLLVGLKFYTYVNSKDDEELIRNNFSRVKVKAGITRLLTEYGLENMADLFFLEETD